jgi:hypothetical protein
MISLKNGAPIRRLSIMSEDKIGDTLFTLGLEDPSSIAFSSEARAAIFLDQVLDLIRSPTTNSPEGRLVFQAVDRSLLLFMKGLIEQYLGACCEAVSISIR